MPGFQISFPIMAQLTKIINLKVTGLAQWLERQPENYSEQRDRIQAEINIPSLGAYRLNQSLSNVPGKIQSPQRRQLFKLSKSDISE